MNDAMSSCEDAYLEEPEHRQYCKCGTQKRNGECPQCDAPEFNPDERIDG